MDRIQWVTIERFIDRNLVVSVQKAEGGPRRKARYSMSVGQLRTDNSVAHYIPVFMDDSTGEFRLHMEYASALASLIRAAQDFIEADMRADWHRYLDEKIKEEEARATPKDRQKVLRPGKTEREREKKAKKKADATAQSASGKK